jgi:hypothetical protein
MISPQDALACGLRRGAPPLSTPPASLTAPARAASIV